MMRGLAAWIVGKLSACAAPRRTGGAGPRCAVRSETIPIQGVRGACPRPAAIKRITDAFTRGALEEDDYRSQLADLRARLGRVSGYRALRRHGLVRFDTAVPTGV